MPINVWHLPEASKVFIIEVSIESHGWCEASHSVDSLPSSTHAQEQASGQANTSCTA
jgi:hypothetical protein